MGSSFEGRAAVRCRHGGCPVSLHLALVKQLVKRTTTNRVGCGRTEETPKAP